MTPRALFPQPKPLEGGPICQESFVNFNIKVRVFVRLMSPRTLSSRQGVGTFCDAVQFRNGQEVEVYGSVGVGYCVKANCPPGLSWAFGMWFGFWWPPKPKLPGAPVGP